ncbi:hypothetical protein LR48_Vigan07g194100 [Vigna angularis]|uniref:Uncharacterized protein n=1 Tax=Phaseolus angularis TaxID=3914 RepID=A0A0L9V053_PHAAN|nr:hypothetical protein LR48_Vigan07g194100 [Vigna angularis]
MNTNIHNKGPMLSLDGPPSRMLEEKLAMITQQQQQQQQNQEQQQEQQQQSQQEDTPTDDPTTPHVFHLEKQPIAQSVNEAREEAEDDNDVISILTSRLNKLRKGPVEMLWELRTFGLECHVPLGHWQLMVIIPKRAQVVWFCSLHRKIKAELKSLIQP